MAKVTLILEDEVVDGKAVVTLYGDFDQPGKSYEEMVANPTPAVAQGLMLMASLMSGADTFEGRVKDEFGNETHYLKTKG